MEEINNKADKIYWNNVWTEKEIIYKIDIHRYNKVMLHELYKKYFIVDKNKSICEIGCSMSENLLYFYDNFEYQINGFDYEENSAIKTDYIYKSMGYQANIYHHDLFSKDNINKYDIISSFGVFEHFRNLSVSIKQTTLYLKKDGLILTLIPNMNGITGFMQKYLNKKVYDIHIPYTKEDIKAAHESSEYETLFCDYYGLYIGGVVNIDGKKYSSFISKLISLPGRPLYYLNKVIHKLFKKRIDTIYNSPYIVYIGKLK